MSEFTLNYRVAIARDRLGHRGDVLQFYATITN